ncbi:MAG TPA: peptide chain release factor-like protein [Candidatus Bathyarchaeia archaeon]|nr:peptide chain release factor-like protein [Candidatus Bathyarchaeia archaeon]
MKENSAILEIRPAAGGDEAKIWADDLARMYTRYANFQRFSVQALDLGVLRISGPDVLNQLKHEAGVHRVQRTPTTERYGRIHTSTATVAVLPEIPEGEIKVDPKNLSWQFFRASTQGGQNVQKVSSAVRIIHQPTGITVSCQQERTQEQNRKIALDLLRSKLWQREQEKKQDALTSLRREAVGRGMRAEKIRTYNFPQNRVTDHRLKKSWKNLDQIINGKLGPVIKVLEKKLG